MEVDNEILIECDISMAISFYGGISGTTDVLVDAVNIFGKRALKKRNPKSELEHKKKELCCHKYLVKVTKSSSLSVLEIIPLTKLPKYTNNDLFLNVFPELSQSSQHSG